MQVDCFYFLYYNYFINHLKGDCIMYFINIDIDSLIKFIGLNICVFYAYTKIINYNCESTFQKLLIIPIIIIFAFLQCLLQPYTPLILRIFLIYFYLCLILSILTKTSISKSIIIITISLASSYIGFFISLWIVLLYIKFNPFNVILTDTEAMSVSTLINVIFIFIFFKIKKFKHGFPFIKNRIRQ